MSSDNFKYIVLRKHQSSLILIGFLTLLLISIMIHKLEWDFHVIQYYLKITCITLLTGTHGLVFSVLTKSIPIFSIFYYLCDMLRYLTNIITKLVNILNIFVLYILQ